MRKSQVLLAILIGSLCFGQIGANIPTTNIGGKESKWTFGGYAGLSGAFGNGGGTSLYLTPKVGYKITNNFEAGIAANINWSNSKYYSANTIGVGPYANYYFARTGYISGLFQEYFVNQKDKVYNLKASSNEAALYLGGGYMQRLGERTYMQIGGLYNVLYNSNRSVFGGAFIPQIGIVYGL